MASDYHPRRKRDGHVGGEKGSLAPLFEVLKSEICKIASDIDNERFRSEEERIRSDESLRKISAKADRLSELIHRILNNPELLAAGPGFAQLARGAERANREREELRFLREKRVGSGASRIRFSWEPDSSAVVQIDDDELALSPKLALLLWALTMDEGVNKKGDGLVGWKRKKEVARQMSFKLPTLEKNIDNLLCRLRKELGKIGYRNFVQGSLQGVRFAVRRRDDSSRASEEI